MELERRIVVLHERVWSALESAMKAHAPWDVCAHLLSSGRLMDEQCFASHRPNRSNRSKAAADVADAERALLDWRSWAER